MVMAPKRLLLKKIENNLKQLDLEIKMASYSNTHVFIEMDSNAKLGKELVPGDPHSQTVNGQHLAWVIEEKDLVIVNGSKVSEGIITRNRATVNWVEEAVLGHVLVSRDLFEVIEKMVVDEVYK